MHEIVSPDSDHGRFLRVIAAVGLGAEHDGLAQWLRARFFDEQAEALVNDCLTRLEHDPASRAAEAPDFHATCASGWIDFLRGFGQDLESADYFQRRLTFFRGCARAGIPLNLLLLQHDLIQRSIIERLAMGGEPPSRIARLVDCVLTVGAFDSYLAAEGYRQPETDVLRESLKVLREEVSHLRHKASTDSLTGLFNYSSLMQTLAGEIGKAQERNQPLCVMMADLDFFKKVNDTHGHLVGDHVLRHAAERIVAAVRDFDIVGRFGGEEFAIVLKNTDIDMAGIIAERIREEIAVAPFHVQGLNISITISLGVAKLRKGEKGEAVLDRADAAMYEAKQTGRNRVVIAR